MKKCTFAPQENKMHKAKNSFRENNILSEGIDTNYGTLYKPTDKESSQEAKIIYYIYFGFDKKRLKYLSSQTAIRCGFSPSPSYCINHIFNYLREHPELLNNKDYKRIYKEAQDYLVLYAVKECAWKRWDIRKNRKDIELLADLWNKHTPSLSKKYTKEQVDEFLEYRKTIWR